MTPDPTLIEPCPFCGEVPTHCTSSGLTECTNADCPVEIKAFSVEDWNTRIGQGSAALPSEAQIEAGADCLRQAGTRGLNAEEAAVEVYTAMRATTPTAPVQDDDAELIARLRKMAKCIYIAVEETVADDVSDGLIKAANRIEHLSPTPETGLVEALRTALDDAVATIAAVRATSVCDDWAEAAKHFHDICGDTLQRISALSNVLPDEV